MQDKKERHIVKYVIAVLLFAVLVFLLAQTYTARIDQELDKTAESLLSSSIAIQVNDFEKTVDNIFSQLEAAAEIFSMNGPESRSHVESFVESGLFDFFFITDTSGSVIYKNAEASALSGVVFQNDEIEDIQTGDRIFSNRMLLDKTGKMYNLLYVPITDGKEEIAGYAVAAWETTKFGKYLLSVFEDGYKYSYITNRDGLILTSNLDNAAAFASVLLLDVYKNQIILEDGSAVVNISNHFKDGAANSFIAMSGGEKKYISYAPVNAGGSELMLVAAISRDRVALEVQYIKSLFIEIIFTILAFFVILLVLLLYFLITKNKQLETERKNLEWNKKKYITLQNSFDDGIYEYNHVTGEFIFNNRFRELFDVHGDFTIQDMLNSLHPDDNVTNQRLWEDGVLKNTDSDGSLKVDMRIYNKALDEYKWHRFIILTHCDENAKLLSAIGKIQDIDDYKIATEALSREAKTDMLTGVLNRRYTEYEITRVINESPDSENAFLILDIDAFKGINDQYGHDIGDVTLKFVSEKLNKLFRKSDIIGRLGGDEFVVFMRNISDGDIITRHISRFNEELAKPNDSIPFKIRCSIGVSIYPVNGDTFSKLYKKADLALYESKFSETDKCAIYGTKKYISDKMERYSRNGNSLYIIDPEKYELLYINDTIKRFDPNIRTGEPCYKTLMGRDSMCNDCPASKWNVSGKMIYECTFKNPRIGRAVDVTVSEIPWNNVCEAVMLSFKDK